MKRSASSVYVFFTVILIALAVKLFAFDVMFVSGKSMEPTLSHGNPVIEFKLAWGIPLPFGNTYIARWGEPKPGDVLIYPWNGRYVIKRCVAIGGMPLVFSEESGYSVSVAGRSVPLTGAQYQKMKTASRVPDGTVFALGDNMAESRDSREYGFVSIDSIRGKILWK
jgi:signal peptidase I